MSEVRKAVDAVVAGGELAKLATDHARLTQALSDAQDRAEWEAIGKEVYMRKIAEAKQQIALLTGAMAAQDDRERQAGEKCGVPYDLHTCDWPEWVTEEVLNLRQEISTAQAQRFRLEQELADEHDARTSAEQQIAALTEALEKARTAAERIKTECVLHGDSTYLFSQDIELLADTVLAALAAVREEQP